MAEPTATLPTDKVLGVLCSHYRGWTKAPCDPHTEAITTVLAAILVDLGLTDAANAALRDPLPSVRVTPRGVMYGDGDKLAAEMASTLDKMVQETAERLQAAQEAEVARMLPLWPEGAGEPNLIFDQRGALLGLGPKGQLGDPGVILVPAQEIRLAVKGAFGAYSPISTTSQAGPR